MEGQPSGGDPFHWTVPVEDPAGREHKLKIGIRDGRVVVIPPPGEGFSMSALGAHQAAASFDAASRVAGPRPFGEMGK